MILKIGFDTVLKVVLCKVSPKCTEKLNDMKKLTVDKLQQTLKVTQSQVLRRTNGTANWKPTKSYTHRTM